MDSLVIFLFFSYFLNKIQIKMYFKVLTFLVDNCTLNKKKKKK